MRVAGSETATMTDRSIEHCLIETVGGGDRQRIPRAHNCPVREMVAWYLARIERFNREGPALNAVRTLNPRALDAASRADDELARGVDRGPLHGIPVLLKDNILTARDEGIRGRCGAGRFHAEARERRWCGGCAKRARSCSARPT